MTKSQENISAIVCCQCNDTPDFAKSAYRLLVHSHVIDDDEDITVVSSDKDRESLLKVLSKLPSQDAYKAVTAVASGDKFAVYMRMCSDGSIDMVWNLLTGRRIPWAC